MTPVTPVMIIAPSIESLEDAGYETLYEVYADTPPDSGDEELDTWEPTRPEASGWVLHAKTWTEDGEFLAVWARQMGR